MKKINIHDLSFVPYLSEEDIQQDLNSLASSISAKFQDKKPVFIVVLNGAFVFAADLLKKLDFDCEVGFIRLSSYKGTASTGDVKETLSLTVNIEGRHVIIVEDIIDTGLTLEKLRGDIQSLNPESMSLCTLLYKPEAFKSDYPIDFIGREIPNKFVVGYGLDYDEFGRNLPEIYQLED